MRGRKEGSIRKRPDGQWEARISLGPGVRRSFYGATKDEVLEKMNRARFEAGQGYAEGSKLTVKQYLERWLTGTVEKTCRPETIKSYTNTVKKHIIPAVGPTLLADLTPLSMEGFQDNLKRLDVEAFSAWYACIVLKIAVRTAVRKGVLKVDPFSTVELHKPDRKPFAYWSVEQATEFFADREKNKDPLLAFYVLAVHAGLRHGELLGLKWSDVDLKKGAITVRRTLHDEVVGGTYDSEKKRKVGGTVVFTYGPPKSKAGEATISISSIAVGYLERHHASMRSNVGKMQAALKNGLADFVFLTTNGTHYIQDNVRKSFYRAVKALGLPRVTVHDLRHTCATIFLDAGKSMKEIQTQLRQSNIASTNIYAHVTRRMTEGMATTMDGVFGVKSKAKEKK